MKKILVVMALAMALVWGVGGASAERMTPVTFIADGPALVISSVEVATGSDCGIYYKIAEGDWLLIPDVGMTMDQISQDTQVWFAIGPNDNSLCNIADVTFIDLDYGEKAVVNFTTYCGNCTGSLGSFTCENFRTAVPIPAAAWLLGSGLLGLVGIRRRKREKSRK